MDRQLADRLGLEVRHLQIVTDLLHKHVPNRPVWAFGSRAFGRARRYSDLDLAVGGVGKLAIGTRYDLTDELEESMLPIEVDVVDLNDIDDSFRSRIEPDFLLIENRNDSAGASKGDTSAGDRMNAGEEF